jgi:hypothetical protein
LKLAFGLYFRLIFGWIRTFVSQLRHFEVTVYSRFEFEVEFGAFGPNITHLHLHLSEWGTNRKHLFFNSNPRPRLIRRQVFGLAQSLKNLQELELLGVSLERDNDPKVNDWVYHSLESIQSPQLTKASFGLWLDCLVTIEDCLAKFNWERIDYSLSLSQFSRLNTIDLVVGLDSFTITSQGRAYQCWNKSVPISDMLTSRLPLLSTRTSVNVIIHQAQRVLPYYRIY